MMLDDVLPTKEGFLDDKNVVYHSQKISSFQRGWPMILVKNWNVLPLCFNLKRTEMMFDNVLDRKEAFLEYKNVTLP